MLVAGISSFAVQAGHHLLQEAILVLYLSLCVSPMLHHSPRKGWCCLLLTVVAPVWLALCQFILCERVGLVRTPTLGL